MYNSTNVKYYFVLDNCACPRIEVYSPKYPNGDHRYPNQPQIFGIYSKRFEKVNNRAFYTSEAYGGHYGIWWCHDSDYPLLQWNIGQTNEKGQCRGFGANFQEAVCPQSLSGYTWWLYYGKPGWLAPGKGLAVRCVSDGPKLTSRPDIKFVPTQKFNSTTASNAIPSI